MSRENQLALQAVLKEFGIPLRDDGAMSLMTQERQMLVLGQEPHAVNLLNFLDGVDFDSAWNSKVHGIIFGANT